MQLHGEVPTHRMDAGDSSRSTVLEMELPDGVDRRQGSGHREGINAFWSPEVRRAAIVEQCADFSSPRTSSTDGSTGDPWPCADPCRALWSSTW